MRTSLIVRGTHVQIGVHNPVGLGDSSTLRCNLGLGVLQLDAALHVFRKLESLPKDVVRLDEHQGALAFVLLPLVVSRVPAIGVVRTQVRDVAVPY